VLDKLLASPVWYAQAASQIKRCQPEVADFLLNPARFKSALEPAVGKDLIEALELLAGYDYEFDQNSGWSFWSETVRTKAVAEALLDSTNAAWRAVAVFSLGLRAEAWADLTDFEKASTDANHWVRGSAARALARNIKNRANLEQHLAPLLADTNLPVANVAAVGLLEPETRQAAGLDDELNYFQFESVSGGRTGSSSQNDDRPLTVLEGKPGFLASAQKWLTTANGQESLAFALLLAQYGDFSGVDRLATQLTGLDNERNESATYPLLAGIALSHDAKYLPSLKQIAAAWHEESSLRKVLQAMKGMSGPDARQLRLDINKKIRNVGGASSLSE